MFLEVTVLNRGKVWQRVLINFNQAICVAPATDKEMGCYVITKCEENGIPDKLAYWHIAESLQEIKELLQQP